MLDIIHKKHKDRYRIQFCNENFYHKHQDLFKMWKTKFSALSNVEKLQAWVVALCCLRRPNDWFGGKRQSPLTTISFQHSMCLQELFADTEIQISKKIPENINLFDFINQYRIKALPESCFRSLCFMTDGTYPLQITSGVVAPLELLQIQIEGRRIVSIDEDFKNWPTQLYSGRDFLGFILHDLIHADHFFHKPQHRDGQLGFYKFTEGLIDQPSTQKLLQTPSFKDGFEYLISDMNAHPLHLFQTLHSLLFSTLKNDLESKKIWQSWIENKNISTEQILSLQKVNGPDFQENDAYVIESLSRNWNHSII